MSKLEEAKDAPEEEDDDDADDEAKAEASKYTIVCH